MAVVPDSLTMRRISRAHLEAELGVEVGERLIEEQALRADGQRPGQGDALLLAAGELIGPPVGEDFPCARGRGHRRCAATGRDF